MKEVMKRLFIEESKDVKIQFFRYIFVGGIAFVADWLTLFVLTSGVGINVYISTGFAFLIGLIVNYVLSKCFVFKKELKSKTIEFIVFAVIGIIGLWFTEMLMWLFIEKFKIYYLISKIIIAAVVLIWNFIARKVILYRDK